MAWFRLASFVSSNTGVNWSRLPAGRPPPAPCGRTGWLEPRQPGGRPSAAGDAAVSQPGPTLARGTPVLQGGREGPLGPAVAVRACGQQAGWVTPKQGRALDAAICRGQKILRYPHLIHGVGGGSHESTKQQGTQVGGDRLCSLGGGL
jgi:hypothetical protein